uniref:DUF2655 domain-containing protein n=1 Tax=Echinococcus granulosus TaxID=6210 RepID=A0A068WA33_ECHGR|nr:hypothetical protein EgrG_000961500 [Echinococcus granulosus]
MTSRIRNLFASPCHFSKDHSRGWQMPAVWRCNNTKDLL